MMGQVMLLLPSSIKTLGFLLKEVSPGEGPVEDRYQSLIIKDNHKENPGLPSEETMSYIQLKNIVKVLGELILSEKYEKFNKWEFAETSLISHRK